MGGPARRFLPPPLPLQRQRQLQDLFLSMWRCGQRSCCLCFCSTCLLTICVSSLQIPPISQSSFKSCCYQEATDVQFGHLPPAKDARMVGRTTGLATSPSPPEIRRLVRYGVVHLTCCIQWEHINHDLCWWTQPKCNTGHMWYSGRVCRTWQENNANSNTIHTPNCQSSFLSPKLCLYTSKCRKCKEVHPKLAAPSTHLLAVEVYLGASLLSGLKIHSYSVNKSPAWFSVVRPGPKNCFW